MYKISDIQTNYDAPTSGFSEGKMRDNPGDDTGSAALAQWANDLYYGLASTIKKWKNSGALSSAAESESASDFLQAIEELTGNYVDGVSAWSAATTYTTIGDPVMRFGMQFVNISASNLNHDPITSPTYWMAVPDKREILTASQQGRIYWGDSSAQHDYSNAAYAQYFSMGRHRFGGSAGAVYEAYAVHLDGSAVGSGDLSDIIETWHLKDAFAPGTTGSRTLKDGRNCVPRAVSASGGLNPTIGARLEDALQGHDHKLWVSDNSTGASAFAPSTARGISGVIPSTANSYQNISSSQRLMSGYAADDVPNGTPRTASETRVKSIAVGVPYFYVLVAV